MNKKKGILILITLLIFGGVIWKFYPSNKFLFINARVDVLEKPIPLEFQTSNKVILTLNEGDKIAYSDFEYEKDYAYYEVQVKGQKGYIIFDGNLMTEEK